MPDKGKLPCVIYVNDQGGSVINQEREDVCGTLRSQTKGHEPLVVCYENHPNDSRVRGIGDVCQTLNARCGTGGGNLPLVCTEKRIENEHEPLICFEPGIATRDGGHMNVEVCSTLRAQMGDNLPCVTTIGFKCNPSAKARSNGDAYECPKTVDTSGENAVCFPINSMVLGKDKYKEGDRQCFGIGKDGDPCFTLLANQHHAIAIAGNTIGRLPENGGNGNGFSEELAYTQTATDVMSVAQNMCVRRITPVEAERLMGFPDNWTRIPWNGKPEEECPDSHRYKACGNSKNVNVVRWIGMRIELVERKTRNA